jgi:hypothetical protein
MITATEPLDAPAYQLPDFDWSAPITAELMKTIAEIGDNDMRLRLARHKSITDEAGMALLALGSADIAAALCKNHSTSATVFALAARPKDAARVIRKAARIADEQAAKSRSSFVARIEAEVPLVG